MKNIIELLTSVRNMPRKMSKRSLSLINTLEQQPKRPCKLIDLIKIYKIDESEFPYKEFRGILCQFNESEMHSKTLVSVRICPAKVYENGKYRKRLMYSTCSYLVSNEFYTQREDGFYKVMYVPNECDWAFRLLPPVKLEFFKLSMKFPNKDLQEIRDIVIFKELI